MGHLRAVVQSVKRHIAMPTTTWCNRRVVAGVAAAVTTTALLPYCFHDSASAPQVEEVAVPEVIDDDTASPAPIQFDSAEAAPPSSDTAEVTADYEYEVSPASDEPPSKVHQTDFEVDNPERSGVWLVGTIEVDDEQAVSNPPAINASLTTVDYPLRAIRPQRSGQRNRQRDRR